MILPPELKKDIEDYEKIINQYLEDLKQVLSSKILLAWIMNTCVPEFKETGIEEIVDKYIDKESIIRNGFLPDDPLCKVGEYSASEALTYDLLFTARVPNTDEKVELIINLETKRESSLNYPLESKGIFYCSRMLAAQFDNEFKYKKIKKVYSIWICTNALKEYQNSIITYSMSKIGIPSTEESCDLMSVIMIRLGEPDQENHKGLLKLLAIVLSLDLSPKEKIELLEKEFNL